MPRRGALRGKSITELLDKGEWHRGRWVNICCRKEQNYGSCVLVGRKIGQATVRNRVKRRIRQIAREMGIDAPDCQIALCPKPSAADATHEELRQDISRLLERAGVYGKDTGRTPQAL